MDVNFFLKQRTNLIRHFYEIGAAPFIETKRRIEAAEVPFDDPPYDESGEPAFLDEWLRADTELQLVGRAAVSMLSEALKQFFISWERERWVKPPCQEFFKTEFKKGFLYGYMACFSEATKADLRAECPADLAVIEQVVLARNRSQHTDIHWPAVEHDNETRARYPRPFFVRAEELGLDDDGSWFIGPWLHIDAANFSHAINEVEAFGDWMHRRLEAHFFP
jgi:hypothetical protein